MKPIVAVASAALLLLAATTRAADTPICASADTDPDGDGWGWENSASCIVKGSIADVSARPTDLAKASNGSPYCVSTKSDPDGDGWGYEYGQSCIQKGSKADPAGTTAPPAGSSNATTVPTTPTATASNGSPYCTSADNDPDGDGWGWENQKSCIVHGSAADPDGATQPPAAGSGKCAVDGTVYPVCATDSGSWGYENSSICVSLTFCPVSKPATQTALSTSLVDAEATAPAKTVYAYLNSIWGKKTISGVMDTSWKESDDMFQKVVDDTGKAPALMGYDFLNYQLTYSIDGQKQSEEAIAHWKKGGIVAFNWHWRVDTALEFYTAKVSTQIPIKDNQLDTTSSVFTKLKADMDVIAAEFKKMQDAGVPVLWRPLHEGSGGWFWWGRVRTDGVSAAYAYVQLYRYMFDYFTKTKGLHNLIWVWNGQKQSWYPGDKYVDIVGTDIYDGQKNYISQIKAYNTLKSWPTQTKLVALTENSNIPDPDNIAADGAWWLWFMVWNDGTAGLHVSDSNNFWTGEYFNTDAHKKKVMNHANIITLDELPSFTGSAGEAGSGSSATTTPTTTAPTTTSPTTTTPTTTAPNTTSPATTTPSSSSSSSPTTTSPSTTTPSSTSPSVTTPSSTSPSAGSTSPSATSAATTSPSLTTATPASTKPSRCLRRRT